MASDNKFAHISVNPGDDDVVIHAGAAAVTEDDERDAAAVDNAQYLSDEGHFEAASQSDEGLSSATDNAAQPIVKDKYHETTLEDIQGSTMGTTQKVVIALAIVLVVAVVIWQVFFNA